MCFAGLCFFHSEVVLSLVFIFIDELVLVYSCIFFFFPFFSPLLKGRALKKKICKNVFVVLWQFWCVLFNNNLCPAFLQWATCYVGFQKGRKGGEQVCRMWFKWFVHWIEKGCVAGPMVYGCAFCPLDQKERISSLQFAGNFSPIEKANDHFPVNCLIVAFGLQFRTSCFKVTDALP